jgi:uncharacterized protein (DUF2147 family)
MRHVFLIPFISLLAATPAFASEGGGEGLWMNPKHTLAVHTDTCGQDGAHTLCGRIVWASKQAQADATDASVPRLVGTELLENYRLRAPGVWQGTVFVPDMGRRFASEIDELSSDRLKVKGCILGGLLCKSQVWTRIGQVPA